MPDEPDYYGQTAQVGEHGLTAIDGAIHDLVWRCRMCMETARSKKWFLNHECSTPNESDEQ
jgi:hypothetical protein